MSNRGHEETTEVEVWGYFKRFDCVLSLGVAFVHGTVEDVAQVRFLRGEIREMMMKKKRRSLRFTCR